MGHTEEQKAALAVLDREFQRFEALLEKAPNDWEKAASLLWLERLKGRRNAVRDNFDQSVFENLRFDLNTDYQRHALWLEGRVHSPPTADPSRAWGPHNELTTEERAAGWQLLFDGKSLAGWRHFRGGAPGVPWKVEDGLIHAVATKRQAGDRQMDLITEKKFTDFELAWEWRLAGGANNGVKYFVTEARPTSPGHEYQMIDDFAIGGTTGAPLLRTASFYDALPAAADAPIRPAGQWNESRIMVHGHRVEHWLNGRNVLTYELGSPLVKAALAQSKFKDASGFGNKIAGHIMLTYHGDECWFRNIKLRELK